MRRVWRTLKSLRFYSLYKLMSWPATVSGGEIRIRDTVLEAKVPARVPDPQSQFSQHSTERARWPCTGSGLLQERGPQRWVPDSFIVGSKLACSWLQRKMLFLFYWTVNKPALHSEGRYYLDPLSSRALHYTASLRRQSRIRTVSASAHSSNRIVSQQEGGSWVEVIRPQPPGLQNINVTQWSCGCVVCRAPPEAVQCLPAGLHVLVAQEHSLRSCFGSPEI